jgi:hypothetical protein
MEEPIESFSCKRMMSIGVTAGDNKGVKNI